MPSRPESPVSGRSASVADDIVALLAEADGDAAPGAAAIGEHLRVVASTGSTNADLSTAARDGAPHGSVLIALEQTSGRGRLDRQWASPAGASVSMSVLLRPTVPRAHWAWLPLLTGVAVVEALRATTGVAVTLKWPNDVLAPDGRKLAGLLAEVVAPGAVVLGVGVNITLAEAELPVPQATSLLLAEAPVDRLDRAALTAAVLRAFTRWERAWERAGGDAAASGLRAAYLVACSTLGADVRVTLPGDVVLEGRATDVDDDGRLVVEHAEDGDVVHVVRVAAGDVVHLRRR